MSSRVSLAIVLCEDSVHRDFARHFCKRLGIPSGKLRVVPLASGRGSGEQYVRERFAEEVREYRARSSRATTALIVMIDADTNTVAERDAQLTAELRSHDLEQVQAGEAIAVWIPRRNIETWIRCLLGEEVNEDTDYRKTPISAADRKQAAGTMFEWSRPSAEPSTTPVPSLQRGLKEARRLSA